jgi:hypothetical protein
VREHLRIAGAIGARLRGRDGFDPVDVLVLDDVGPCKCEGDGPVKRPVSSGVRRKPRDADPRSVEQASIVDKPGIYLSVLDDAPCRRQMCNVIDRSDLTFVVATYFVIFPLWHTGLLSGIDLHVSPSYFVDANTGSDRRNIAPILSIQFVTPSKASYSIRAA